MADANFSPIVIVSQAHALGENGSDIPKHFCGERLDRGALFPGIQRQAGFATGLLEEGLAVPVVFQGNLWQEQPSMPRHADQKPMASDFDGFGLNRLWGRQDAEFDFQRRSFRPRHGVEAGVFKGCGASGLGHGAMKRACGEDVTHASPQLTAQVQRSEYAARLGEVFGGRIERNFPSFQGRENRIVRQTKQQGSLVQRVLGLDRHRTMWK